jgi:hypothetical protein
MTALVSTGFPEITLGLNFAFKVSLSKIGRK